MRLFLISRSERFARSVARYVNGNTLMTLSGVAPSLAVADIMLPVIRTDLVLCDWPALVASPGGRLHSLRQFCPGLHIACVVDEAAAYRAAALAAGADAVISNHGFAEELEPLLCDFLSKRGATGGGRDE